MYLQESALTLSIYNEVAIIHSQREGAAKNWDEKEQKRKDFWLALFGSTVFIFPIILLIVSIGSNIFRYEVTTTYTVDVPKTEYYEEYVGTVSTYICYTTDTGDCYHAENCGSLWKSANKTTVYHAKKAGYYPCSKCTPRQKTTVPLTETRTRTVMTEETKTYTETKRPVIKVLLVTLGALAFIILFAYISVCAKEKKARKEYEALNKRWEEIPEDIRSKFLKVL